MGVDGGVGIGMGRSRVGRCPLNMGHGETAWGEVGGWRSRVMAGMGWKWGEGRRWGWAKVARPGGGQ